MNSKTLAELIRNATATELALADDDALSEPGVVGPVREDGHGVNFIVTYPDGDRRRVIVTEP